MVVLFIWYLIETFYFSLLSYLSGIALFVFFNHEDQSEHCYFSENALLPGLVQLNHRIRESQIRNYAEVCSNIQDKYVSILC